MEMVRKSKRMVLGTSSTMVSKDGSQSIPIVVKDISTGGIGISCDVNLQIGNVYSGKVKLWGGEVLDVFFRIVKTYLVNGHTEYGAVFLGLLESEVMKISHYEETFVDAEYKNEQ